MSQGGPARVHLGPQLSGAYQQVPEWSTVERRSAAQDDGRVVYAHRQVLLPLSGCGVCIQEKWMRTGLRRPVLVASQRRLEKSCGDKPEPNNHLNHKPQPPLPQDF